MARRPEAPAQAKQQSVRRHRRRRSIVEETQRHVVMVTGWEYSYWLRIGGDRLHPEPYAELVTLKFRGKIYVPADKPYQRAIVTLSARAGMLQEHWEKRPLGIGGLSLHGDTLDAYIFVPAERMSELVAAAAQIRAIDIGGSKIKRGSGKVHSVSLETEFDAEAYLGY